MATNWTTATDEQILAADLILEQGLDELSVEDQQRVLEQMNEAVEQATLTKAMAKLAKEDLDTIQQLTAAGDASGVRSLLMQKVPDFDRIFQQMVILYKRVILTGERPTNQAAD